ncbi:hypothetical protein GGS20DRAFT_22345 [Poronia punctata]|nr:hypothetical protein GGS20DRAFT_22345 [Poronia punctata]
MHLTLFGYRTYFRYVTVVARVTMLSEQLTGEHGANLRIPTKRTLLSSDGASPGGMTTIHSYWKRKRRYDPDGLLDCWKCVGFEEKDIEIDRYRCRGKLQQDIDRVLKQGPRSAAPRILKVDKCQKQTKLGVV